MSKHKDEIKDTNEKIKDSESIEPEQNEIPEEVEAIDWEDKYLRLLAENQNLLKQTAREKDEFRQFAQMRLIEQILPVYDNLKISLVHSGEEKSNWVQGVEYVVKQFSDVLKQFGVVEAETRGKKFDHNIMEAVSEEETGDKKLDATVAKEITVGYLLGEKVIRPARVVVYKLKATS